MRIKIIVFLASTLLICNMQAQVVPEMFNYSGVAYDGNGNPIVASIIGVQTNILSSSSTGNLVYSENHTVSTDSFGLFNLKIGAGAIQSGSFSAINWSSNNFYLKIGIDITGGNTFIDMGTSPLLSVPYALHSKTAESLVGFAAPFQHYIGEIYGGGVVFSLWKDSQGIEHGLIVDLFDLAYVDWINYPLIYDTLGQEVRNMWNGLSNSYGIVGNPLHTESAAALCLNSINGGYDDWYLPACYEFLELSKNYFLVYPTLKQISSNALLQGEYWSSNENSSDWAYTAEILAFSSFRIITEAKYNPSYVRAIRSF